MKNKLYMSHFSVGAWLICFIRVEESLAHVGWERRRGDVGGRKDYVQVKEFVRSFI